MVVCHGDGFLHYLGAKKDISTKKLFQFDISDINEQNKYGECLLFVASYFSEIEVVINMLNSGANPNIQNNVGNSSLHAAAYFGNLKLMQILVNGGADMRLVNNNGQRPSQVVRNPKNYSKIKAYENSLFSNLQSHLKVNYDPVCIYNKKINILDTFSKSKIHNYSTVIPHFIFSSGFGNFIWKNRSIQGLVTSVKTLCNSSEIGKEQILPNFMYGNFAFYNGFWNHEKITIKMIKSVTGKENTFELKEELMSNLLYKETNYISSIRHPNILLLMCVNLVINDSIPTLYHQLLFERIKLGSLYHILYNKEEDLMIDVKHMFSQVISAVNFLHSHSLIHCSISSNAIYLIDDDTVKLGNFEYITELKIPTFKNKNYYISQVNMNDNIYKWLAPEVMNNSQSISAATDVYGLAITIYETFIKKIPNYDRSFKSVLNDFKIPYANNLIANVPLELRNILEKSFNIDSNERPSIRDIQNYFLKDIESIYASIKKSPNSLTKPKKCEIIPNSQTNNSTENASSTKIFSPKITRKSNSISCLSPQNSEYQSLTSSSTFRKPPPSHTSSVCSSLYRELAALPSSVPWKYPGPQTERSVEGVGTFSNSTHQDCIRRGMKPASHQISLCSSQTSISELPGNPIDLIKTSSRPDIQSSPPSVYSKLKLPSPAFSDTNESCKQNVSISPLTNKTNQKESPKTVISKPTQSTAINSRFNPRYQKLKENSTEKLNLSNRKSPMSPKIANLVNQYEKSPNHPYGSIPSISNNSSPVAESYNWKPLCNKLENPKIKDYRINNKPRVFNDLTNKFK